MKKFLLSATLLICFAATGRAQDTTSADEQLKRGLEYYNVGNYTEAARTKATTSTTARQKFCRILVDHYNRGLAARSKKRLMWEG